MFFVNRNGRPEASPTVVCDDDAVPGVLDAKPIDLWDAWLFAEAESSLTLNAWGTAAIDDRARAHAAYRAAADREEQAARVLAARLETWREGD